MADDNKWSRGFFASCERCAWLETYTTRADAADAQKSHDSIHEMVWRLSASDRVFLKVNRIAASEDE